METLEKVIAKITVNGKNVTADVSPYLSRLSYADKEEAESDDLTLTFEDTTDHWKNGWYPEQGDTLEVSIGTPDAPLDCGLFEIDEIGLEFPPDTVAIKAIGAAISKALRSKNSKAFEKQSLKQIAQYFATKHGLKLVGNVSDLQKIEVERKTQEKQTDLAFLSRLAREYGIVFSVRGDQLVFMDTEELESQPVVMTIHKNELSRASFTDKTQYEDQQRPAMEDRAVRPRGRQGHIVERHVAGRRYGRERDAGPSQGQGCVERKKQGQNNGEHHRCGECQAGSGDQYRADWHRQVFRKVACGIVGS